jgi:hypothetical protein
MKNSSTEKSTVDRPEENNRFTYSGLARTIRWFSVFTVPTLLIVGLDGDVTSTIALTLSLLAVGVIEATVVLGLVLIGILVYPQVAQIPLAHVDGWIVWIAVTYMAFHIVRKRSVHSSADTPRKYALWQPKTYRALLCVCGTAFFVLVLFRWFSLFQTIGCAALMFGTAHVVKARHGLPNVAMGKLAANAALTLASTAVSIVLMELCLALVLNPDSGSFRLYETSSDYIFRLRPNADGFFRFKVTKSESRTVSYHISAQGFRDREFEAKASEEFRIAMLGDSFTFGRPVAQENTIPKYLERILNDDDESESISVINAGMNGAGPWQEFGIFTDRVLPLDPDLVILQVFLANDIDNALEKVDKQPQAYDRGWHSTLKRHRRRNTVSGRVEDWVWHKSRVYREMCKATDSDFWVYELVSHFRLVPKVAGVRNPPNAKRPFWMEANIKEWYPDLEEGFKILGDYILSMDRVCQEKGIDFAVYAIPLPGEIYDELWEVDMQHVPPDAEYERTKALRRLYEFLETNEVSHFDVTDPIRNTGPIDSTFYLLDGHLTEQGNEAVARKTSEFIQANKFLNRHGKDAPL